MFSLEDRKRFIEETFKTNKVTVITYEGLTIDLCHRINADFILRGLRNPADFEFEKPSHTLTGVYLK
jgi:pantetheine-phosphate adenylyltransferase